MKRTIDSARPRTLGDMAEDLSMELKRDPMNLIGRTVTVTVRCLDRKWSSLGGGRMARYCPEMFAD